MLQRIRWQPLQVRLGWRHQRSFIIHLSSAGLVAEQTLVLRECAAAEQSAKMWAGDQSANVCPDTT